MRLASLGLDRIRRQLDPAFSYILFERKSGQGTMEDVVDLVKKLDIPILEAKLHEDRTTGRIFLVVKLDPEAAKQISREYVSVSMPENVTCLFYSNLVQDVRKGGAGPARKGSRARGQHKIKKRRREV